MIGELLHHADQDVELAQRGIVFIDEIDKIARRSHGARTGAGLARHRRRGRPAGAAQAAGGAGDLRPAQRHPALEQARLRRRRHAGHPVHRRGDVLRPAPGRGRRKPVGFGAERDGDAAPRRRVSEKELLDYGFLAEFLGRLPVRVELTPLSEDDLLPDHDRPARRGGARVPGAAEDGRRRPALLRGGAAADRALLPARRPARAACAPSSRRFATTSCSRRPSARARP